MSASYIIKCYHYRAPAANLPENKVFNPSEASEIIQVKKKADFRKVNRWIIVTLILHNFLMAENNEADFEDDDDESDDEMPDLVRADLPANEEEAALTLRGRVQRHLLAWHFANNPNQA